MGTMVRLFGHTVVTITQLKRTSGSSLAFLKSTKLTLRMLSDVELMMTISQRPQTANHLLLFPPLLKNLKKEAGRNPRNQRISSSIRQHKHLASPNICRANGQVERDLTLAVLGITL